MYSSERSSSRAVVGIAAPRRERARSRRSRHRRAARRLSRRARDPRLAAGVGFARDAPTPRSTAPYASLSFMLTKCAAQNADRTAPSGTEHVRATATGCSGGTAKSAMTIRPQVPPADLDHQRTPRAARTPTSSAGEHARARPSTRVAARSASRRRASSAARWSRMNSDVGQRVHATASSPALRRRPVGAAAGAASVRRRCDRRVGAWRAHSSATRR